MDIDPAQFEELALRKTGKTQQQWNRAHDHKRKIAMEWIYKRRLIFPNEFFRLMSEADLEGDDFVLISVPTEVVQRYRRFEPRYNDQTGKHDSFLTMYVMRSQLSEVEPNVYSL